MCAICGHWTLSGVACPSRKISTMSAAPPSSLIHELIVPNGGALLLAAVISNMCVELLSFG
ncbi:hypothetical protein OBBRIDRAFT_794802 [Obba rivulosa]|uniref:Uncharacterized protein n=1 Tax=Obba rivulosa TaxID=1052685 RepID=A0A8E2AR96_9APHY|nr:hypothetical protein OBBRIDRAFT_794802 [Obba rivulosa]